MTDEAVHRHSPSEAKIALFRSLFRGRDDVCARRFESKKTDKAGYQPACGNEWDRVLCDKRRVKSPVCQNRRFLPLTDEVIRRHLSGRDETGKDIVVGVYPMLQDETCFFLAVDFDKKSWSEDAGAYLETSRQLGLTACLERSRSGCGGRIWLFFQKPIPDALARKLGSHILTETMEPRPDIGLDSYDRLIPNQDTLPTGGFGNLIAQRRVNTLVPVHRRQLMEQWVDRLSAFLGSPMKAIGSIGSGKKKPIGMVDVALIQSLVRKGVVDDVVGEYGHSATVTRKDGRHPIIFMQCGPVRYRVDAKKQTYLHPFAHTVVVCPTGFYPTRPPNPTLEASSVNFSPSRKPRPSGLGQK